MSARNKHVLTPKKSKKIFVVITGRNEDSADIYSSWKEVQHHIQGVKKSSGTVVEWESFEGIHKDSDALLYWHSHYREPPPSQTRQAPPNKPAPAHNTRYSQQHQQVAQQSSSANRTRQTNDRGTPYADNYKQNRHQDYYEDKYWTEDYPPDLINQETRSKSTPTPAPAPQKYWKEDYKKEDFHTEQIRHASQDNRAHTPATTHASTTRVNSEKPPTPPTEEAQSGKPHWAEEYVRNRLKQLKYVRQKLPSPPATEPVDRQNILASIVSHEWLTNHQIPVASDLVDSEYQLTHEVYRRILYTDCWEEKDHQIYTYLTIVDAKRDYHLLGSSDVTYQCLDRHAKHVRRTAHDAAQIVSSQRIEKSLFEANQALEKSSLELEKAVLKLRRDLASEKKKNFQFSTNKNTPEKKSDNSSDIAEAFPQKQVTFEEAISTPTVSTTYTNSNGESTVQTIFATVMPKTNPTPASQPVDTPPTTPPSSPESQASTVSTSEHPHLNNTSTREGNNCRTHTTGVNDELPPFLHHPVTDVLLGYLTTDNRGNTYYGLPSDLTESQRQGFLYESRRLKKLQAKVSETPPPPPKQAAADETLNATRITRSQSILSNFDKDKAEVNAHLALLVKQKYDSQQHTETENDRDSVLDYFKVDIDLTTNNDPDGNDCKLCIAGSGKKQGHVGVHRNSLRPIQNQSETSNQRVAPQGERHGSTTTR